MDLTFQSAELPRSSERNGVDLPGGNANCAGVQMSVDLDMDDVTAGLELDDVRFVVASREQPLIDPDWRAHRRGKLDGTKFLPDQRQEPACALALNIIDAVMLLVEINAKTPRGGDRISGAPFALR